MLFLMILYFSQACTLLLLSVFRRVHKTRWLLVLLSLVISCNTNHNYQFNCLVAILMILVDGWQLYLSNASAEWRRFYKNAKEHVMLCLAIEVAFVISSFQSH